MDDTQCAAVVAEALTWINTPYHYHARVKGVGVDCAQLLCAVYEACGLVPHIDPGNYAHDWHLHRGEEVFIGWLERVGAREVLAPDRPVPGDVVLFKYGRAYSHGGILPESQGELTVVHAYLMRGVIRSRLEDEPLQGRGVRFWSVDPAA
jgi:cell wall-associated NlpC family hydrolase